MTRSPADVGMIGSADPFQALRHEISMSGSSEGVKKFFEIALETPVVGIETEPYHRSDGTVMGAGMPPGPAMTPVLGSDSWTSMPIWLFSRTADACFEQTIRRGLPVKAIDVLISYDVLSPSEVATHFLPRRTLDHRKKKNEPLTESESERALRIARIIAFAEDTFANTDKAATWLRRPSRLTGGRSPLDMADTEPGGRIVEEALQRIAHGIAA